MVNPLVARKVVGILGNLISFGLFLSPLPTFAKIWKKKAVEEFSPVPYLITLLNCGLWVFYGLPVVTKNNTLVYTINGTGFLLETIYIIVFFVFSPPKLKVKVLKIFTAELAFMGVVFTCVLTLVSSREKRTLIIGILALIFNTFMYAAPFSVMKLVIQTKSVEYMPFFLSLMGFFNGLIWMSYALLKFDTFILIPNAMGSILGIAQLLMYFWYYDSTPEEKEGKEKEKEKLPSTLEDEKNKITKGEVDMSKVPSKADDGLGVV